jgi:hypothetical protein
MAEDTAAIAEQRPEPKPQQSQEERLRLSSPTRRQVDYLQRLLLERGLTLEQAELKLGKVKTKAEASLAINRLKAGLALVE